MSSTSFLPRRRKLLAVAALAAGATAVALPAAHAQSFPERPVRIVVPFPPGGAVDALARVVAEQLATKWKQGVVVDNKPGGNQIIGTQNVATAAADGYTILLATTGHAVNATLIEKLPYDPLKDFSALTLSATAPNILVVNPVVPATTLQQLVAYAKANPGKLSAGHPGNGTTLHLSLEILKAATGTDFTIVGYKGTAPSLNAVLAKEVDFMFDVTAAVPHVKAGKLRALAVTSATRSPLLPEVPTLAEAGLPGVEIFSWYAFLAPAGTPRAVVDRLNRDINDVLDQPAIRQRLTAYGLEPGRRMQASEVDTFIRGEAARWGKVVKDAKVKAD
jgi:tripartite-type tricarboxylate transporter receptor subunit TctC